MIRFWSMLRAASLVPLHVGMSAPPIHGSGFDTHFACPGLEYPKHEKILGLNENLPFWIGTYIYIYAIYAVCIRIYIYIYMYIHIYISPSIYVKIEGSCPYTHTAIKLQ